MLEPLVFGMYPLGISAGPNGPVSGPPDDIGRIGLALTDLAGHGPPLLVRMYVTYEGDVDASLSQVSQFAQLGGLVDLSLNYHDPAGGVTRWCTFVEQVVRRHGSQVGSIGVTNEANLLNVPYAPDGAYPNALEALVDGVLAAAEAKRATSSSAALGFTTASDTTSAADVFWRRFRERGSPGACDAIEFAGLTMYPGGFGAWVPSLPDVAERTTEMLTRYRAQLSSAGIPETLPIRVCESGWPTGPGRTEADQARILETIVRTVAGLKTDLGITHWELFTLRDADSSSDDTFGRFGILRDEYTPKPAYAVVRDLIRARV